MLELHSRLKYLYRKEKKKKKALRETNTQALCCVSPVNADLTSPHFMQQPGRQQDLISCQEF